MPTYTYQCQSCGYRYDAFQSMKEEPHTECPVCKGRVERLIGAGAGIVFKGSGFYVTDYRKSAPSESSTAAAASSGASSSSSDS
jgi:putative FmdB family regulatory protein